MRIKILFQKTLKELSSRALTRSLINSPFTIIKMLSKHAKNLDFSIGYTRMRKIGRKNVQKMNILRVYMARNSGNKKNERAHAPNLDFSAFSRPVFFTRV